MPTTSKFIYDAFISYRQQEPDKTWVHETLVPRLKKEGLCIFIDYQNFRLGAPLVEEIERAVEQSRYTLAILSPAYLESNFTDLENVLAQHLGLEKSQRRLIPIMRQACKPRLGIAARLWLDMTNDREFESNVTRLIFELQQLPNR